VGTIVVSDEGLRAVDQATQQAILSVLVAEAAAESNRVLVAALTAGSGVASTTPAAVLAALIRPRKPYLVTSLADLLDLPPGTVRDLQAAGVGVLTAPEAAGLLIAVDAAGLVVSDSGAEVRVAHHATLMLDLTGGSPAAPVPVSLFQSNLTALSALRYLRISVRDGASAFAPAGSPA
jgi:hypothetical protein